MTKTTIKWFKKEPKIHTRNEQRLQVSIKVDILSLNTTTKQVTEEITKSVCKELAKSI